MLSLVALAVIGYLIFFKLFLPSYTNFNESVLVPDVTEGSLSEAIEDLEGKELRWEIADSIYVSSLAPEAVISQDPPGQSEVKPGRRIYLTVNKKVPPMVKIPKIFSVSTYQAKLLLDGAGLRIKKINYIPDEFKNLVRYGEFKGKRIKEGDTLPKFSELILYAGRGLGSQKVGVPDLVGLNYLEAISILHKYGLNIGPVRFDPKASESNGTVIRQDPRYYSGDSLTLGQTVTMFIAGPEPEEGIEDMYFESSEVGDEDGDKEDQDADEAKPDNPDGDKAEENEAVEEVGNQLP